MSLINRRFNSDETFEGSEQTEKIIEELENGSINITINNIVNKQQE